MSRGQIALGLVASRQSAKSEVGVCCTRPEEVGTTQLHSKVTRAPKPMHAAKVSL
jgi:hypothetical protein